MDGASRDVAAIARMVHFGFAIQDQHHFAAQDDVCCLRVVFVIRVESVRTVLPDISVAKTFVVQGGSQFFFVHADWILSEVRRFPHNNVKSLATKLHRVFER